MDEYEYYKKAFGDHADGVARAFRDLANQIDAIKEASIGSDNLSGGASGIVDAIGWAVANAKVGRLGTLGHGADVARENQDKTNE